MRDIHKRDAEYKLWKKRNDEKKNRNRLKSKRKHMRQHKNVETRRNNSLPYKTFNVPKIFSIINNSEDTILFLNDIIGHVEKIRKIVKTNNNKSNFVRTFSINMDNTTEITGDALMYLLTIIKNTRGKKLLPINWIGNFPKNENMKTFLQNSGYLKYMKTAKENLVKTNEHIQIQTGQGYEYKDGNELIDIRQKIIDFTCEK